MRFTVKNDDSHSISWCVIVPTYNNARTLEKVLTEVLRITGNVVVVNDGSTDDTSNILAKFPQIRVIEFSHNKGKGVALREGFRLAGGLGYDYAVTIDSDGQHHPEDIPALVKCFRSEPGKMVMGSRNMQQEGVPAKSSFGNSFSNFWFWAETGIKLSDTQTGFRAYPLKAVNKLKYFTKRFEFEIEVIVRLAWMNVKFCEVPVSVDYPEDRVSHFRPFKDFVRISILNTILFFSALAFFLPRLFLLNFSLKRIFGVLKTEMLKDRDHPVKLSLAVATGLFFGIFPVWGFQMAIAFAVASVLKLNRVVVLLVSNISIPPMIPFIIYFSFKFGALFVANPVSLILDSSIDITTIYLQLRQYIIGAVLLSVTAAVLGFFVTRIVFWFLPKADD